MAEQIPQQLMRVRCALRKPLAVAPGAGSDVKRRAKHVLRRLERKVRRIARSAQTPEDFHRLRIQGKRLRYAAEIFSPLVLKRDPSQLIKACRRFQDTLGDARDYAAVGARCQAMLDSDPDLEPLARRFEETSQATYEQVPRLVRRIAKAMPL
jgi:CHAD domain-containing protein